MPTSVSRTGKNFYEFWDELPSEMVTILHAVHDCRDVRDNHILEVAVNGQAQVIVTGDEDLLVLNPFRGITILRPADYLKWEEFSPSLSS